jgi:hypothetical protein
LGLDKAHSYAKYFTGRYNYTSSTTYTYGRPRFAAWALLGKEVQDAATSLGIPFPESLRFPAMPDLAASQTYFCGFLESLRIVDTVVECRAFAFRGQWARWRRHDGRRAS